MGGEGLLGFIGWPLVVVVLAVFIISTLVFLASRYKRCPSDQILVIYGKVGEGQSARCIHGGGALVWPLIQDYCYMSLTPMTINIPLSKALSMQNIRINVPSTFTVGISTEPQIMTNAAERLLNLPKEVIEDMAMEIIFGQLRLTVASLTIEEINQDRERFLEAIRRNVEPELNKIGLYLINVNITDITDESDYIESIGKKAAAEAINQAKVDVAVQDKTGSIGEAEAFREKEIKVAENVAQAEKGKKAAEADRRVYVQQQESKATIGEAEANKELNIKVAENEAQAEKGKKAAEADRRIYVQQQEAEAVGGENKAKADIADADAQLAIKQAEAKRQGEVAKRQAEVEIQKAQYLAEQQRLNAEQIVVQETEKQKIEIAAEAEAEKTRREAKGQADAVLFKYQAEAQGVRQVLQSKAEGYNLLVRSCAGDAKAAATFLLVEKLEELVKVQVEAIKNLKIDKITVWDGGGQDGGKTATADFLSGMVKSLPPLHEVAGMAGVDLPQYLGDMAAEKEPKEEKKPVQSPNTVRVSVPKPAAGLKAPEPPKEPEGKE
ncbi:flotillin [Desulfatibacillum alkenivorans DSM 16219]|jgi:flotillin|uniref:Flotillin n=1 Tax=Desulfatibacillum alkenivorans DSM 16219 TaxID=1121393 RepID=A0A1M6BKJ9_9BACT|nr:flotillin family protein [Desulfatibacillum alkenivorans]SHI49310.1 flotillin [Desulfatibacillum alkenivorans DSM 16219]